MAKMVKLRLSQSWQVQQKPDKQGRQYPPILERLEIEVEVPMEEVALTYTQLNSQLFNARVQHMKNIKQKTSLDSFVKESGF